MQKYKNLNGNSNVEAYEIGPNLIVVKFKGTAKLYRYTYASAGHANVEHAKQLAQKGSGLNSLIMTHMRTLYEK